MEKKKLTEKFLNLSIGTFFYFKKIVDEIEKEGKEHSNDLGKIKAEIEKLLKIPKKLFENFMKSCGFITRDEFEKLKEEIKNG
ncbi:MAG: hypothetical protein ACP5OB_05725 [Candidatus Ratteibacteria bacterium]